ncbi:MAG: ferredoxin-NADP reductase [Gammaproteobacteria bacterium]|nr:ferredoxin-NADP reductase [Gammaproteobacteria bacterium]
MHIEDLDLSTQCDAVVAATQRITPEKARDEVREIILEVDNAHCDCKAGQSIGVLVPGPHEIGHDYHVRLYSVADIPAPQTGPKRRITIVVRRSNYIDDYSGEEYKGVASNYLCDLHEGDHVRISGPYGIPFEIPDDRSANLLMISLGTGIAPFRAFVKHIYHDVGNWTGKVRLFYGAHTGLDMLYMNQERDDFNLYYDEETFKAFQALNPRPHWDDYIAMDQTLEAHEQEVWDMLCAHNTYVYIAGLPAINVMLDKAFSKMAGSPEKWQRRRKELIAGGRWTELLY